jgi:hypothetical protein
MGEPEQHLLEQHPGAVLSVLDKMLRGDSLRWPYWAGSVLDKLAALHPDLATDRRLLTLKRRRERL